MTEHPSTSENPTKTEVAPPVFETEKTPQAKLKPEVKEAWLKALRSGDYAQGKHRLLTTHGAAFCCLGVLCDLGVKAGIIERSDREPIPGYQDVTFGGETHYPPAEVTNWATEGNVPLVAGEADLMAAWFVPMPEGLEDSMYVSQGGRISLAALNDEYGYTFAQLADLIEKHL